MLAAGALFATWRSRPALDDNLLAIAPFDAIDADMQLWKDGMVDVLSRNLDGAGQLRTVAPSIVIRKWSGHADRNSAIELGNATGARYVVYGGLTAGGDTVRTSVSVVDVRTSRTIGNGIERKDQRARVDRLADSITFGLVRALNRTTPGAERLSSIGTTSLPALKAFLQGEQFYRQSSWDSALAAYARALALDSTFALASRGVAMANGWARGGEDSVTIVYQRRAGRFNHGLSTRDSLLIAADSIETLAWGAQDRQDLRTLQRLFATLDLAARRYPGDPGILYAKADAQFHWAWGPVVGLPPERIMASFDRAIAADSSVSPVYLHAIALAFRLGGLEAGQRYLKAYLAQNPTDREADAMRVVARLTDPKTATSAETMRMLDTASNNVLTFGAAAMLGYPDSAQTGVRLASLLSPSRRSGWIVLSDTLRERRRLASQLLVRGRAREAFATSRAHGWQRPVYALVGGYPAESITAIRARLIAKNDCVPCWLDFFASRNDTTFLLEMTRQLEEYARSGKDPEFRQVAPFYRQLFLANLQLARRDSVDALRLLQTLPDSICHSCGYSDLTLAQLLEAKGRDREAMDVLDKNGVDNSTFVTLLIFERARVAERLGDRAVAVDSYLYIAEAWQFADSAFQPYVKASHEALKRLGGENAPRIKIGTQ